MLNVKDVYNSLKVAEKIMNFVEESKKENYDEYFRSIIGLPTIRKSSRTADVASRFRKKKAYKGEEHKVRGHLNSKSLRFYNPESITRQKVIYSRPIHKKQALHFNRLQTGDLINDIIVL